MIRQLERATIFALGMAATAVADVGMPVGGGGVSLMTGPAFANEVERSLVRAIVGLKETSLRQAVDEIDKALAKSPNFRLGYLVKGDILMAMAGKPVAFAYTAANADSVASLQDEARARLQRYVDAPPIQYLPAALLQLAPSQRHALLVDTSRSRLFVYANDSGTPRYVTDFYISLGKNGVEKQREGDQKTPIGVYTVVSSKEKLPDFYGAGAFALSYPNEWDRLNHRNGHGIWLHGTPSETYSRPPWATDGCVVLTNDDLERLARYVDVSRTPVVIGSSVAWHDAKQWQTEREQFMAEFKRWRSDWESMDVERYFSHYSPSFRVENGDLAAWKAHKRKVQAGKSWIKVGVDDFSLFAYPGTKDLVMVTFEQDYRSNNLSNRTLKRQYWSREGGQWRIVHEAILS